MLDKNISKIIEHSKQYGWILEPDAKFIFSKYNIDIPKYKLVKTFEEAENFIKEIDFPVVCKIVSPEIVHKSDCNGVFVGIKSINELKDAFNSLSKLKGFKGVLIEEMASGVELIIGAKNDEQFGPVVLTGLGGVAVEIYQDVAIKMAPLNEKDVLDMLESLQCYPLLKGYRGSEGINIKKLIEMLITFSNLLIDFKDFFESIDLNPVFCSKEKIVVADARIILKTD